MRKGFTLIELMIVIAIIAIIAAIAIPNLLESRVTANEAAASSTLKAGVFPAEVQFQGGAYQDRDSDNVGEYGTLGTLAGRSPTTNIAINNLKLLQGPLAADVNPASVTRTGSGYMYTTIIPAMSAGGNYVPGLGLNVEGVDQSGLAAPVAATDNYNDAERNFVCGCQPERFGDSGRRVFVLAHDGQLRSPAAVADTNFWWGGGAPTNGLAGAVGLLQAGMANSFGSNIAVPVPFVPGTLNMSGAAHRYPVYTK